MRESHSLIFVVMLVSFIASAFTDLSAHSIRGLESIVEPLPWFDNQKNYEGYDVEISENRPDQVTAVTSLKRRRMETPLYLRLSRTEYPAEDGYLDVTVILDAPEDRPVKGVLIVRMLDDRQNEISCERIENIPGDQLFFSYAYPDALIGGAGTLEVSWQHEGERVNESAHFRVLPRELHKDTGRIRLDLDNPLAVNAEGIPQTIGVPFPRGVLKDTSNLRLVDEAGIIVPMQAEVTARWSRYGSARWVLLDFVTNLEGAPRHFYLEYGPDITRSELPDIVVQTESQGFPEIDAGWLRVGKHGVSVITDTGEHQVLPVQALLGAFVEKVEGVQPVGWGHHFMASSGSEFTIPPDVEFFVEQVGPEKVVLKISGDYLREGQGDPFCQYVIRYVIFRNSSLIRVFHTWVFTGDGNREQIHNMGWRMPFGDSLKPLGFLSGFDEEGKWLPGYYLRQEDHNQYSLFAYEEPHRGSRIADWMTARRPIRKSGEGFRAPGVMAAEGEGVRLFFGVKDFWQNFPNSLMQTEEGMTFYQWPRYGSERTHPVSSNDIGDVWRLWFAHEGEVLSFSLPIELTEGPLYVAESGPEPHIDYGRPDSMNAQGVAKTAEMWLYITDDSAALEESVVVLEALNEEKVRSVVDPVWMAQSGAFYEINAKDVEQYPEQEQRYEQSMLSILNMVERMGIYGKWIYGDLLRPADLDEQTSGLYRTFRKAHWGWPYSWIPYVRSGDPRFYKFAEAATRMMSDVAFCHYVSDDVRTQFEQMSERRLWISKQPFREIGWHNRNLIPWGGYWGPTTRMYVDKADYLWHAWLLTGYDRARDVALTWAEQTKIEMPDKMGRGAITAGWNRARWPVNLQKQYMEMYEMTYDPWFLEAAHAIAELHGHRWKEEGWNGHLWTTGTREFQRYTGDEEHLQFYLNFAKSFGDWQQTGWASTPTTLIPVTVFAWYLTEDHYYLRRAAGILDLMKWATYDAEEPEWYKGWYSLGTANDHLLYAGWLQQYFPLLMELFDRAGGIPEDFIPLAYTQRIQAGDRLIVEKVSDEPLSIRLPGGGRILDSQGRVVVEGKEVSEIPQGTADGLYFIEPNGRSLVLPITPPGTREVYQIAKNTVQSTQKFGQHWFYVPEGVSTFRIEFRNTEPDRQPLRQVKVWSSSGAEVWSYHQGTVDYNSQEKIVATIEVPMGEAGLWRITQGAQTSMPFTLDGQLPGIISHSPDRWIAPSEIPEQ